MHGCLRRQITILEAVAKMSEYGVQALFTMPSWVCDGIKRWRARVCQDTTVNVSMLSLHLQLGIVGFASKKTSSGVNLS